MQSSLPIVVNPKAPKVGSNTTPSYVVIFDWVRNGQPVIKRGKPARTSRTSGDWRRLVKVYEDAKRDGLNPVFEVSYYDGKLTREVNKLFR